MIIPTYNWQFTPQVEDADFTKIAKKAGLGPEAARLLFSRGIKDEDGLTRFLAPSLDDLHDPYLLHDMDKAVNRIRRAIGGIYSRLWRLRCGWDDISFNP